MTVAAVAWRECECGSWHMIFQTEKADMAHNIQSVSTGVDVFICGELAICSKCGRVIDLPPAEILDVDRSTTASYLQEFERRRLGR